MAISNQMLTCVSVNSNGSDKPFAQIYGQVKFFDQKDAVKKLRKLILQRGLNGWPCCITLPQNQYEFVLTQAPQVPEHEMTEALRWQIQDLTSHAAANMVIDYIHLPPSRVGSSIKQLYVVVAGKSQLKTHINLIVEQQLNLKYVDIPEMALRNLALLFPENKKGLALLWLNQNEGLILITKDQQILLARHLNIGHQLLNQNSENQKLLIEEVQRSLHYIESHFQDTRIEKLRVLPSFAATTLLVKHLRESGIESDLADIHNYISFPQENVDVLNAGTLIALGAALRNNHANENRN